LINNENDSTGQTLATTNEDKVDILNNYFASVFINETFGEVEEEAISGIPHMDKIVIEEDVILKKLFNINVNKSAGADQIHPRVLYELRNEIAYPLKLIFEQTIKEKSYQLTGRWEMYRQYIRRVVNLMPTIIVN